MIWQIGGNVTASPSPDLNGPLLLTPSSS